MKILRKAIFLILITTLLNSLQLSINAEQKTTKEKRLKKSLIVYSKGDFSYRYAQTLSVYLGHFNVSKRIVFQGDYVKGELEKYDNIFYLGAQYSKPKKEFLEDIKKTKKNIVWIYGNIGFLNRFTKEKLGWKVDGFSKINYVSYKGVDLNSNVHEITKVKFYESNKPKVVATASKNLVDSIPYVIRGKNFTYFTANPFIGPTDESPVQIFADYLHEVIENDHKPHKSGIVRIEDVSPKANLDNLKIMIDYLYIREIPFSIGVIPVYKKSPKAKPLFAHQKPEFVRLLKYAKKKGATFVLHGYTHQYRTETAEDAEFWDLKTNKPINNTKDTEKRLKLAIKEMNRIGIKLVIWETPHYAAGEADRKVFAKYFKIAFERQGISGDIPVPYLIERNKYGQKVIPETLTYPSPKEELKQTSDYIVNKAKKIQLVRDGYGAFFIHSFMPISTLHEIISGMQDAGYKFVSPNQVIGEPVYKPKKPNFLDRVSFEMLSTTYKYGYWSVISTLFISYYLIIFGLSFRSRSKKLEPVTESNKFVFFVIPALNEEKVIERTIRNLLALENKNFKVIAVNDNSDDNTEKIFKSIESDRFEYLNTSPPFARAGKGNALNYAYRYISVHPITSKYKREDILICIVDSDGHVDPQIINKITPYFNDKKTGAAQASVKIINNNDNLLTRWQDFEFRVFNYIFQSARELLGSVGLGGNGQFVRLTAADSLGKDPWSNCLTEDLEIGLRLMLGGWRNRYCASTYVAQQAVPKFWLLIRQRTRWVQGHLSCWKFLPKLAASDLPLRTRLDTAYYLMAIVFIFVVIPTNFVSMGVLGYLVFNPGTLLLVLATFGSKAFIIGYLLNFGAVPIFVFSYWKTKEQSLVSSIVLTHIYLFVSIVWLFAGYKAIFGIARKKSRWVKTPRFVLSGEDS